MPLPASSVPLQESSPAATRYSRSFFLAMMTSALYFLSLQALLPVLPLYALEIGVDEAAWGLAVSAVSVAAVTLRLLGGSLADRIGRKGVMVAGALVSILAAAIMWLTASFAGLLVGRALQGVSIGLFTTAYKALVMDLAPPTRRGQAIGLGNLTFGFSLITAPPLGEWVQHTYGYGMTFLLSIGIMVLVLVAINLVSFSGHRPTTHSILSGTRHVLPLRTTQIGIWGMLSNAVLFSSIFSFLPLLAAARGVSGVGLAFSAYALTELLGQPLGGWLGDHLRRRLVVAAALLVGGLGIFCFLVSGGRFLIYVGAALVGLGSSVMRVNLDTIVLSGAPLDLRGTATGLEYASFDTWIGTLGWLLGIVTVRSGYTTIYTIMALVPPLWAVLMWFLIPPDLDAAIATTSVEAGAPADR